MNPTERLAKATLLLLKNAAVRAFCTWTSKLNGVASSVRNEPQMLPARSVTQIQTSSAAPLGR